MLITAIIFYVKLPLPSSYSPWIRPFLFKKVSFVAEILLASHTYIHISSLFINSPPNLVAYISPNHTHEAEDKNARLWNYKEKKGKTPKPRSWTAYRTKLIKEMQADSLKKKKQKTNKFKFLYSIPPASLPMILWSNNFPCETNSQTVLLTIK